jgi:Gamma-glutamyl cyclotransferase, AIG2-like
LNDSGPQFVFGYGSLTARSGHRPTRELKEHGFVADLVRFRRTWGVAMDNRRDLPGYKYYTAADGSRPQVCVAYLDITPDDRGAVNGLCMPVEPDKLPQLDARERNYVRVDVSDHVDAGGARVWAYSGRSDSRARLREARAAGRAVIDAGYRRGVEAAFAALGEHELALCRPSLAPGGLPVCELVRHELPSVDPDR